MRLGKDGEAIREMLACKSPAHAAAVQSRWIEQTLRDYGSEMSKAGMPVLQIDEPR
jgi:hypothetical protein